VLVLGEAGIGKTRLLAVAGGLARAAGIRTFRAAGAPLALFYHGHPEEAAGVLEAAIADLEGPAEQVRERRLRLEADFAIVSFARAADRPRDRAAGLGRG
jgi:hypothetical protein